MKTSSPRPPPRPLAAFTLVEIMIVVVIIGLLAAIAIPAFKRVQDSARANRATNDFRVFTQAFETYSLQNGGWPPNASAGVVPTGMSGDFKASNWAATTSLGGRWNWDRNLGGVIAGISIQNFTATDAQLASIDAKLDDGDLSTGHFQKVSATRVTYILEQ
jgi:prepilin-type N-terminal cleavage/methylation domain-containing protein